ncbi:YccV-like-domain-containing protein [Aspergillus affinis]|uniref:YccV-like-domain-containing protein n=1 Tax=Aspergillus affinis TaxID=1070780 RepID=UPI0022FF127F|nr:YccV-like-domain-containing protein [Aspergillus affinis]KAI9040523.1 YccV-like-domain-containing protein [Aspergillus affinis]
MECDGGRSSLSAVNWKALYISRHLADRSTCEILDSILATQTGRIEKFRSILDYGCDAKDALLRNISAAEDGGDYLARRYFSQSLLASLHRSIAIPEWSRLGNNENVPLERALGAFDLFMPESGYGSLDEIKRKLDGISAAVFVQNPDIGQYTPRDKARAIAFHLRQGNLTGIEQGREYHCLEHNFLGVALNEPGHNSLPLVSATIYCYVAERLGLRARPCGFPFHVHVIVQPPRGFDMDGNVLDGIEGDPIYMDPFRSDRETPVADLESQLNFLGASPLERAALLGESSTSDIVLRCSKNILNSVQRMSRRSDILTSVDVASATYAALWSAMLLSHSSHPAELRHHLRWLMELFATEFPFDTLLVERYIAPLFHGMVEHEHILENLHVMRAVDELPKQEKRRTSYAGNIKYRIGQLLRHRRYEYRAVITGWDVELDTSEHWVDHLGGGRHQIFYHVLFEDGTVRYVAEENVDIIFPCASELPPSLFAVAGKYFKRWDDENRIFRKIDEYEVQEEDIYNVDEKGFLIGVLAKGKRIFSKKAYERDGNREWITTIACICADGTSLSPGLIYQAASSKLQASWLQDFEALQHKCFLASSPSGWTNDELGYAWLRDIFDRETKAKARRRWGLLILDRRLRGVYSPKKIQQARDLQAEKDEALQLAKASKEEERLRKQCEKEEKRLLIEERKRIRASNKEIRLREAEEKKRKNQDDQLAKQADIQLQNNFNNQFGSARQK